MGRCSWEGHVLCTDCDNLCDFHCRAESMTRVMLCRDPHIHTSRPTPAIDHFTPVPSLQQSSTVSFLHTLLALPSTL